AGERCALAEDLDDRFADQPYAPAPQPLLDLVPERLDRRGEQREVVAPLPDQLRLVQAQGAGGQHAQALVAHLPAVAVGAVQDTDAPALGEAGDLWEPVG